MQRSLSPSSAIALAGVLAIVLTRCAGGGSGESASSMPSRPPVATVEVSTTLDVMPTTSAPVVTTVAPTSAAPPTTIVPTTTTTTATTTTTTTTTAPPTTSAPTTAPPTTAAPTTAAPTTVAPTTVAPTTVAPTTAAPTTATPTTAPPTTAAPPTPGATASPDAVTFTNQQRQAAGLPALVTNGALTAAAAQHSQDQAGRGSMSHTGSDGSNAGQRISANGGSFSTWAENVAAGYGSASGVIDGWMNSAGHRDNILNTSMTQIGVAVAISADGTPYWTMVLSG